MSFEIMTWSFRLVYDSAIPSLNMVQYFICLKRKEQCNFEEKVQIPTIYHSLFTQGVTTALSHFLMSTFVH